MDGLARNTMMLVLPSLLSFNNKILLRYLWAQQGFVVHVLFVLQEEHAVKTIKAANEDIAHLEAEVYKQQILLQINFTDFNHKTFGRFWHTLEE